MPKKKDVFVWVAKSCDGDVAICPEKPIIDEEKQVYTAGAYFLTLYKNLGRFGLKKGQCKKYKLVEVKGGE